VLHPSFRVWFRSREKKPKKSMHEPVARKDGPNVRRIDGPGRRLPQEATAWELMPLLVLNPVWIISRVNKEESLIRRP
jgi:hypothetical protein